MLKPLPVLPYNVWQAVAIGDVAYRLFNSIKNIRSVSMHPGGEYVFGLGNHYNQNGPFEVRLFCGFGLNCKEPAKWCFQVRRFFSLEKKACYKVGIEYYEEFVEKHGLVTIAGNVDPNNL